MNSVMILGLGGAAVFGAALMAAALFLGARMSKPAPAPAPPVELSPEETPTAEHDSLADDFNEACDDLLPLYIADYPGMPLGDTEERVIRDIERQLVVRDPDFLKFFERTEGEAS